METGCRRRFQINEYFGISITRLDYLRRKLWCERSLRYYRKGPHSRSDKKLARPRLERHRQRHSLWSDSIRMEATPRKIFEPTHYPSEQKEWDKGNRQECQHGFKCPAPSRRSVKHNAETSRQLTERTFHRNSSSKTQQNRNDRIYEFGLRSGQRNSWTDLTYGLLLAESQDLKVNKITIFPVSITCNKSWMINEPKRWGMQPQMLRGGGWLKTGMWAICRDLTLHERRVQSSVTSDIRTPLESGERRDVRPQRMIRSEQISSRWI